MHKVILAAVIFFIFSGNLWSAPAHTDYEQLKAKSLSIRNTDIQLKRKEEWLSIAKGLENWAKINAKSSQAAEALFNAGVLWGILFQATNSDEYGAKAEDVLLSIFEKYPASKQAETALLKVGDIYRVTKRDTEGANEFYQKLVDLYPNSDVAVIAAERLSGEGSELSDRKEYIEEESADSTKRQHVIVLDPGHGGEDLGAVSATGLMEKDVALMISLELEKLLTKRLPVKVILTRRSDVFVPLAARTELANANQANIFVSLHVNASQSAKASGLEVYYLDNTDDQASQKLAERENASMDFEGQPDDLQFIMSDMIQNAKLDESIALARVFDQQLTSFLKPRWPGIRSLGIKKAPFYVLVGAHMPCVLVELFFINHPVDGANLIKREFRHDLSEGLYLAIKNYLTKL